MEDLDKNLKENNYSRYFFIFAQIIIPILFGFYSVKLGQDINWDLQNYHLYNLYALLNHRLGFDLAPAGLQTYFNPLIDAPYFFALKMFSPKVCGFLFGFIHGINFVLLFKICSYCLKSAELRYNKQLALMLASLGVLSVGFLSEIGTTMGDDLVSLFILTSLLIIIRSVNLILVNKIRYTIFSIALAGLIAGMGVGLKLTIAIYAIALCFSLFFISVAWIKKIIFITIFGLGVGLGFLVTGGAWYYNTWHNFGNPIFPMYNDVFKGELAQDVPIKDGRFLPKNTFEKFFYPVIFTINPLRVAELRYEQFSWIAIFGIFILFFINNCILYLKRIRPKVLTQEARFILLFFGVSYLMWLNLFGIYRYTITIEILIPLVVFIIFVSMFKEMWARFSIILILISLTFFNLYGIVDWGHSRWTNQVSLASAVATSIKNESIGSVILIGQPLAWIVPILDMNVPFIQVMPNFPVSQAYWRKANFIIENYNKKKLVIFDDAVVTKSNIELSLKNVNISLNTDTCQSREFYIGTQKYVYKFCLIEN